MEQNKNITEEEILRAAGVAYAAGKNQIKLYFMDGLPGETYEDIEGISTLASHVVDEYYRTPNRNKARQPQVTLSVACFIPKPHTPFQWEKQITPEEYLRRCRLLKSHLYSKSIEYNYHGPDLSRLEAVFARGDRRLGAVIEAAVNHGARLDGWDEYFDYSKWLTAFEQCGIDPDFYTVRGYEENEVLPWDTVDVGVSKRFHLCERKRAYASLVTPDCREKCAGCGANGLLGEVSCDA